MKAVRLNEFGDVDVLKIEEVPEPNLRPHHVMIKVDSAGVNYADILRRGGNYPGPDCPHPWGWNRLAPSPKSAQTSPA